MAKTAQHFVDSDITGTSGTDAWTSNNYSFDTSVSTKIGISTPAELAQVGNGTAEYPVDGYYELQNDIDLDVAPYNTGEGFPGIYLQTSINEGTFDGRYFTISNLYMNRPTTSQGLFLVTGGGGDTTDVTISNLLLKDIDITGGTNTGGLAGQVSRTTFTNCRVTGAITHGGAGTVGGFVAGLSSASRITCIRCSFVGTITANRTEGGNMNGLGLFAGRATGGSGADLSNFTDCYSQGTLTATVVAGRTVTLTAGFYGRTIVDNALSVTCSNCYTGSVVTANLGTVKGFGGAETTIDSCYWDTTIGPATDAAVAVGKTTTQMYAEATFDGWDFDTVWEIDEGSGYPTHQWFSVNPYQVKTGEQNRTTAMPEDYSHLEGQSVQILQDGVQTANQTVASGDVTLTGTVNHVGLQYTSTVKPMKIDGEVNVKRIRHIIPNVNNSLEGNYGRDSGNMYSMVLRDSGDIMDGDEDLHTGNVELPFDGIVDRKGDIIITQDKPLAMNLLGIGVKYSQEDI